MDTARLDRMARQLVEARRAGARITLDDTPQDFEEGFAVQERVVGALGSPVTGWKVIEMPNGPVIFAPLLQDGIVAEAGTWTVAGDQPAGIELEIAFRMARDVEPDADRDGILGAIGSAHVVFELCQSRIVAPEALPRHVTLADCILNSGVVVGPEIRDWRSRDLKGVAGRLLVDGKLHGDGKSVDPIRAIEVLAPAMAARGKTLRAGQVVITGSLIGMHWLSGQHELVGEIDGCGTVKASLKAH